MVVDPEVLLSNEPSLPVSKVVPAGQSLKSLQLMFPVSGVTGNMLPVPPVPVKLPLFPVPPVPGDPPVPGLDICFTPAHPQPAQIDTAKARVNFGNRLEPKGEEVVRRIVLLRCRGRAARAQGSLVSP